MIYKTMFGIILFILADFFAAKIFIDDAKTRAIITRQEHSYYHHTLRPFVNYKDKWGKNYYPLITNNLGFKDVSNQVIPNKVNKKRILFMGDSFTEGIGIPFENTFCGILKEKYPDLDILNAGVASYSPKLYHLKTKYLLEELKLRFDELFVFIDISDIQDEVVYLNFKPQKPYETTNFQKSKTIIRDYLIQHSILGNRAYRFYIGDLLIMKKEVKNSKKKSYKETIRDNPEEWRALYHTRYFEERDKWTSSDSIFNQWGEYGLKLSKKNMTLLAALCQKNSIKLTLAVYPWPIQITQHEINCEQVKFWKTFAQSSDISFLNYFPKFMESSYKQENIKKYFIPNDVHWNENGHQLIANGIELYE